MVRPDAFLLLYAVTDRKSFETATALARHVRCELGVDRPILLVANKTDLKRQQKVTAKGKNSVWFLDDFFFIDDGKE